MEKYLNFLLFYYYILWIWEKIKEEEKGRKLEGFKKTLLWSFALTSIYVNWLTYHIIWNTNIRILVNLLQKEKEHTLLLSYKCSFKPLLTRWASGINTIEYLYNDPTKSYFQSPGVFHWNIIKLLKTMFKVKFFF